MNLNSIKRIHLIGIGGIGNSAIAKLMLAQNKIVSGSDLMPSEIIEELEKNGVKIFIGHQAKNLNKETDLVVYSPAVPEDNPERQKVFELKIPQLSYPQFLGELSKKRFTIAVSGTNGKSTTTALLGLFAEMAGLDPLVIVGSKVPRWNGNLRIGDSQYFIVEACEWRAHMLNLQPKVIVLTNLEEDHLDYYCDINHIIKTFQDYIENLPEDGLLILNADDSNLTKLRPKCRVATYGIKNKADVMAKNIVIKDGRQEFDLFHHSKFIIHISLNIPGLFNIYNALAAITCALNLGVNPEIIKKILENFYGIWRRFERKELKIKKLKLEIISDYAHHPTAVAGTIKAAREFYPKKRIVAVFQPHHRNRTKKLFEEFVKSFDQADLVIISEIYDVAGRERKGDIDISSEDLVKAIINYQKGIKKVFYCRDLSETKKQLLEIIQPNDVVLVMGAGDIYKIVNF